MGIPPRSLLSVPNINVHHSQIPTSTVINRMNSFSERNNPPPRRKSCEACRAAKRRCNLDLPTCFRCTQRGLACVYPGLPSAELLPELLELISETSVAEYSCASQFTFTPAPGLDLHDAHPQALFAPSTLQTIPQDLSPVIYLQSNEMIHIPTKYSTPLSALMASRFQYAIDRLMDTPRMMVTENQTPWSHSQLYKDGMPQAMQGILSWCIVCMSFHIN